MMNMIVRQTTQLAGLILTLAMTPSALAVPVMIRQTLDYSYTYQPKCAGDLDQFGGCPEEFVRPPTDVVGTQMKNEILKPSTVLTPDRTDNSMTGLDAAFVIDVDNGRKLKSHTELRVVGNNQNVQRDDLMAINLTATSQIFFSDLAFTDDPNGEIFRFETVVTGNLFTTRAYSPTGATENYSGLYPAPGDPGARYVNTVNLTAGLDTSPFFDVQSIQLETIDAGGFQKEIGFVDSTKSVETTYKFFDILFAGDPVAFRFDYSDKASLEVNGLDVSFFGATLSNDLSNTVTTYASVFNAAGELLPNARVRSTSGFTYEPLLQFANNGGGNAVPTPGTLALMLVALLALVNSRRQPRAV